MADDLLTRTYISLQEKFKRRAARILGASDEVEDTLQDAFYRLWTRHYDIRSGPEAEALLSTAVRNASIDRLRRRKETVPLDKAGGMEDGRMEAAERKMKLAIVNEIVESRLSEIQRYILRRKEYEDVSLEEIAKELGMQGAAVRMQLSRARKTILECYKEYGKKV